MRPNTKTVVVAVAFEVKNMLLEIREIGAIWINRFKIIERKIKSMWENICLASHLADEFRLCQPYVPSVVTKLNASKYGFLLAKPCLFSWNLIPEFTLRQIFHGKVLNIIVPDSWIEFLLCRYFPAQLSGRFFFFWGGGEFPFPIYLFLFFCKRFVSLLQYLSTKTK